MLGRTGCLILVCLLTGCRYRQSEVAGTWRWGTETVRFSEDGSWEGYEDRDPSFLSQSGKWEMRGDRLKLDFDTIDPPNPDPDLFDLSADGKRLVPVEGAQAGMVKSD